MRVTLAAAAVVASAHVATVLSQSAGGSAPAITSIEGRQAVAGEVLVQFAATPSAAGSARALDAQVDAAENVPVGSGGLRRVRSRAFDVEALLAFYRAQPGVVFAEPNYIVRAAGGPSDPHFESLWGLLNTGQRIVGTFGAPGADIGAASAWDVSTGSRKHVIAVVDSGIDYTHPDLAANVWSAPAPFSVTIGGITIHCPAGSHGFNAIARTCDPMDAESHGTHVAGTIGAVGNNGLGVAGVNWAASIIGGRFLDEFGVGTTAGAIETIEFMIQTKEAFAASGGADIRILNNSWGGGAFSMALRDAIERAASRDMLFVAAAGNGARDTDAAPHYPSSYDVHNVVAVSATTNQDFLWSSSNYGLQSVDLGAPGEFILSTVPGGGYVFRSGTSMAAPHVAGAAALLLSACTLDTAALKQALLTAVDPVPALTGLVATGGRLNVGRAIRSCAGLSLPAAPAGLAARAGENTVTLSWDAVGTATGYIVKRSTTAGGPYEVLSSGVTATSYEDSARAANHPYFYVVSAVNGTGEGEESSEVSASPFDAPRRVKTLRAAPGDARVTLSWEAAPGATTYRVKRSVERAGPYEQVGLTAGTSFIDLTVVNGTRYFYTVSTVGPLSESRDSGKAAARPLPVPVPPAGVNAAPGSEPGTIDLSWDAAASGRRHYYVVTGVNGSGKSAFSVEVSAVAK